MTDVAIVYATGRSEPRAPLLERGVSEDAIKGFFEIQPPTFGATYKAAINRDVCDPEKVQAVCESGMVYAALVSAEGGRLESFSQDMDEDPVFLEGTDVNWQTIGRMAELSGRHRELLDDLGRTEDRCLNAGPASVRGRDLLETYEYLDAEISKLESALTALRLVS